jgi:Flp pilus assembly pilin Flp
MVTIGYLKECKNLSFFTEMRVMITLVEWRGGHEEIPAWTSKNIPLASRLAGGKTMFRDFVHKLWAAEEGQDIAEYAVMLAVILVIVVGTIRLIGSNANNVFSNVASSMQ